MNKEQNIPSNWLQVPLSDLFLDPNNSIVGGPFGSNLKSDEYKVEGVPIIRIQNIDRNRFIDKNINFVTEEKADFLSKHSFQSGDIIITKLGEPVGKACLVPDKYEHGIIVADLIRVRIDQNHISKKFILYQLNSSYLIKQFDKYTSGTTRQRIKLSIVRDLIFNIPPLEEQYSIVENIEELFSELDYSVSNLKLALNQLKVYRQALLKHAFEGKLTENWRQETKLVPAQKTIKRIKVKIKNKYQKDINNWENDLDKWDKDSGKNKPIKPKSIVFDSSLKPHSIKSWCTVSLKDVCYKITDGSHNPPKKMDKGFPMLSARNIEDNRIVFNDYRFIEEASFDIEYSRANVELGDVLITIVGTIGRASIVPKNMPKFTLQRSVALLKPIINEKYLFYAIQSTMFQKQLIDNAKGTAQKGVYLGTLRSLIIPLCSEKEQELIIYELEAQFSVIDNMEKMIQDGLQKSEILRQSILEKAFKGQLAPQNSKNESATELLKCIKLEKKKHLEELKQEKKKSHKKTYKMAKELSIEEVLKTSDKPMLGKDVWQQSKHKGNIEEFYAELKKIQENIKVVKNDTESLLTLTK